MNPTEEPRPPAHGAWFTRYHEVVEYDVHGRRVFRFHRRFPRPEFDYLDVLLAVAVAVAVVALSDSLRFDVDHIALHLRSDDASRLGPDLHIDTDWPKWANTAEIVDDEPYGDADLTVVLLGADAA